jgi:hypothetical protein
MKRMLVAFAGVALLATGLVSARRMELDQVRSGALKAHGSIKSGDEVSFRERLPRGLYVISVHGTQGYRWRSDGRPDDRGPTSRDKPYPLQPQRFQPLSKEPDRKGGPKAEASAPDDSDIPVERRYSGDGKLDAIRPLQEAARNLGHPGGREIEWNRSLPRSYRDGPDVDLYVFDRSGRLIARSDSSENSETVLLDVNGPFGDRLEIVVHSARGSGEFYLTAVRF